MSTRLAKAVVPLRYWPVLRIVYTVHRNALFKTIVFWWRPYRACWYMGKTMVFPLIIVYQRYDDPDVVKNLS
jgi:hypothetical protein